LLEVELLNKPENSNCIDYACFIHDQHKITSLDALHSISTMNSTQIYFPARKAVHCDLALVPWPELNSTDYSHVCDIYIYISHIYIYILDAM
jgi:hypothetical protein